MRNLWIITVTILLAVLAAAPVNAQMRMRGEYGRGQYTVVDITKLPDLNLTQEQTARLRTMHKNNLREVKPYLDQMRARSMELKELWLMTEPKLDKIDDLQHELLKLRAVIMEINAAYRQGSLKLLTEKQRTVLESCEEKSGYGFGRGMRGRGGMERLE
ncbi:MAG TPA: periplasmic heavy metal sensor [Smithellaceae bacterium]|nr:periplasmic heavy metal sensor [Smithellaceae bacterium]